MPRSRSYTQDDLIHAAMDRFWRYGFHATSMDDLVKAAGVSRHGIYANFGGKRDLFLSCLEAYRDGVVTPAFAQVEAGGAGLDEIGAYFEIQIGRAEAAGLPGPGCLIANTMTELGPHDQAVCAKIGEHNKRLQSGFRNAFLNTASNRRNKTRVRRADDLAAFLTVFTNGLWSMSRSVCDADTLRRSVCTALQIAKSSLET